MKPIGRQSDDEPPRESFWPSTSTASRRRTSCGRPSARAPLPAGIECATVDDTLFTETFDCRVVVYLTGDFDVADGPSMARDYATGLSSLLDCPAYSLNDLLRIDPVMD